MAFKIDTVSARDKLPRKREPYWHKLQKGCFIGFRKMGVKSEGTWVARHQDLTRKTVYKPLGALDEAPKHERFDLASKMAREWLEHLGKGGAKTDITVKEACNRLIAHYNSQNRAGSAKDAEGRFKRWVFSNEAFASTALSKLTPALINDWRVRMANTPAIHQDKSVPTGRKRANTTINRDTAVLKTALNLAFEDGYITSDYAWKSKLKPLKVGPVQRKCYLTKIQRRALIDHAENDIAPFFQGLSLLPLRPGALAALTCHDFDKELSVLTVRKDKAKADRHIPLPPSTKDFFAEQIQGKRMSDPIFTQGSGDGWNKDAWKKPFKVAAREAGIPSQATTYSLRHSTITDLIVIHGMDILTVAQLSGTSVAMIEKHYGHLLRDRAAAGLESLNL
jgi:integrase